MNAIEDKTLTREARIGLLIFLLSEKKRHYKDIKMIDSMILRLQNELNIGPNELSMYNLLADRYVELDDE